MKVLNLLDRWYEFQLAYSKKEKLKKGAAICGVALANTAIAATKIGVEVIKSLPAHIEAQNARSQKGK